MTERGKTLAFAAVAAALAVVAWAGAPSGSVEVEGLSDQGQAFYPDFTDPLKAASLEVVDYDEATGQARPFKVEIRNGRWAIPSHHDYPADAKERLAKTAAALIDLRKDQVRSDDPALHERFGVVDPLDAQAPGTKGRGQRVSIRDVSGNVLLDLVFGKKTRGEEFRYVRVPGPGKKRSYAVKMGEEISAKFSDWIETDLLKLSASAIRRILIDRYSVDEEKGEIKDRAAYALARKDGSADWTLDGLKEEEEVNADVAREITRALDDLKIVGVRPKPPFLVEALKASGDFTFDRKGLTREQIASMQSLQSKGYYPVIMGEQASIASNEGELAVSCDDGVVYTLRFGEVLVGSGEEIERGVEEEEGEEKPAGEKKEGAESRYLFVTARFDEGLLGEAPKEPGLGEPPAEPPPVDPNLKDEEKAKDEERFKVQKEAYDAKRAEVDRLKKEFEDQKKAHDKKVEDGKKRTKELTDRFADWYYVIPAEGFQKLRRERADLVKLKNKPEESEGPPEK